MKTFIFTGLVSLAVPLVHAALNANLLVNPGAEDGLNGWTVSGDAEVMTWIHQYGSSYPDFDTPMYPEPPSRGDAYFIGTMDGELSDISQSIDLSFLDWGGSDGFSFQASGWLGGWEIQEDHAIVSIEFFASDSTSLGSMSMATVTAADRDNQTSFYYRELNGTVPTGANSATFTVTFIRDAGRNNDGYADNLSFTVIPEPSSSALLVGSLALLTLPRRRQ